MRKFDIKLGSAVAIAAFVATVIAPAGLAETTVDVTNNGAQSNNTVNVSNSNGSGSGVKQVNNSTIVNGVTVKQNTGNNSASFNTGGDTGIETGNAASTVTVAVGGSANVASTDDCGCTSNTTVNISDNGARSDNTVNIKNGSKYAKKANVQKNNSVITNAVAVKQVTGKNKAKFNTGGSTGVATGNTTSNVTVNVTGSTNGLNP